MRREICRTTISFVFVAVLVLSCSAGSRAANFAVRQFRMKPIYIGRKFTNMAVKDFRGARFSPQKFQPGRWLRRVGEKFRNAGNNMERYRTGFDQRRFAWNMGWKTRKFDPHYGKFGDQRYRQENLRNRYVGSTLPRAVNLW